MNILIIGKFPPIEGGVSRNNNILASMYSKLGHNVYALTNSGDYPDHTLLYGDFTPRGYMIYDISVSIKATPQSDGSFTRLCSYATSIINKYSIDIIICSYLEPYGMVALLMSKLFKTPFIIIHAGSDIGRLCTYKSLKESYEQVFKNSTLIVTNEGRHRYFEGLNIPKNKLYPSFFPGIDKMFFNEKPDAFSFDDFLVKYKKSSHYKSNKKFMKLPYGFNNDTYNIFMYGKLGICKGIYESLECVKRINEKSYTINLYLMCHGDNREHLKLNSFIESNNLSRSVFILPFVQNYMIPSFIKKMNVVMFLENNFDIKSHSPVIPSETILCGVPIIISEEIYEKQSFIKNKLEKNVSVYCVDKKNMSSSLEELLNRLLIDNDGVKKIANMALISATCIKTPNDMMHYAERLLQQALTNNLEYKNERHT